MPSTFVHTRARGPSFRKGGSIPCFSNPSTTQEGRSQQISRSVNTTAFLSFEGPLYATAASFHDSSQMRRPCGQKQILLPSSMRGDCPPKITPSQLFSDVTQPNFAENTYCRPISTLDSAYPKAVRPSSFNSGHARIALLTVLNPLILQKSKSWKDRSSQLQDSSQDIRISDEQQPSVSGSSSFLPIATAVPRVDQRLATTTVTLTGYRQPQLKASPLTHVNVVLPRPKLAEVQAPPLVEDCPSVASTATSVGGHESIDDDGLTSGSEATRLEEPHHLTTQSRLHPILARLFNQAAADKKQQERKNEEVVAKFANPCFMRSPEPADLPIPFGLRPREDKLSHRSVSFNGTTASTIERDV